jgi:hypothetical protein
MNTDMHSEPGTWQENTLAVALERVAAGESLTAILADAGADAEWLEPLLSAASAVHGLREVVPAPAAEASLARFLAQAERIRVQVTPRPAQRRWWEGWADSLRLPSLAFPRLAAMAASALLAILALTLGTALFLGAPATAAAQNVLPGQLAYPIKRLGEEIYLHLPQSEQSRSTRSADYDGRRQDEVRTLLNRHLEACVTFRGEVEVLRAAETVVGDISVQLVGETRIEGPLAVGAHVLVEACTQSNGVLAARHIVVEQPAQPTATPSPTPSPQPTSTATVTPQPTPAPTLTPSAVPAPTEMVPEAAATDEVTTEPAADDELHTPTPTREPEPTATFTPAPTEETPELPGEGGNENDGGGNEGNDNGGNDNSNDNEGNSNDGNDNSNDNEGNDNDSGGGGEDGNSNDNDSGGGGEDGNSNDNDSSGRSGDGDANDNDNDSV